MSRTPSITPITRDFMQFLWLQEDIKNLTEQATRLKKNLLAHAEEHGEADEKGHLVFGLDRLIETNGKKFIGFKRERRVTQSFNDERAEELCLAKGIAREDYISVEEYVDQDKIARLYAEDILNDEEFNSLIDTNETWAFVPVREA